MAERLRSLRSWVGMPYREVHRQVVRRRRHRGIAELPAYATVYRCFQPGRARMDADLVVDVVHALLGDHAAVAEWRQACQVIDGRAAEASVVEVSTELAPDEPHFTGRRSAVRRVLEAAGADQPAQLVMIHGMAGAGKTTFATHVGHRLAGLERFAGLKLVVNLRGWDPDRPPADPASVLGGFLRRLGVRGSELQPLGLADRAAAYRELIAKRRALVVLDNAGSEDQLAPLIADGDNCLTLVTSRRRLTVPGAGEVVEVGIEPFESVESVELLRTASASTAIASTPDLAGRIGDLCGHLPLALALVAFWIAERPDWTLDEHLDRLLDRRDTLRLDDAVGVALGSSYDGLPEAQRRMLRLLTLHPGPDLDPYAAAALAGAGLPDATGMLDGLVAASMVQRRAAGRFMLHDLVRVYAAQRTREEDRPAVRRSALHRLYDHYRYAAMLAMDRYAPQERGRWPQIAVPATPSRAIPDRKVATGWLDEERANLLAVAVDARGHGAGEHAADLSVLLFRFLDGAAHHQDAVLLHEVAAGAVDGTKRARAVTNLGTACWRLGRYDEAWTHYQAALAIHRQTGNRAGEGTALTSLGMTCASLDRLPAAIEHFEAAIGILAGIGDRVAVGVARGNLGYALERSGRYQEALEQNLLQLRLARDLEDRAAEGVALGNIGSVHQSLGRFESALEHHEQAIAIAREAGYRAGELPLLIDLGADLRALGRLAEAADCYRAALSIATELGKPDQAARAQEGLAGTGQ